MDDSLKWFLMKYDDGTVFGPMTFDHLRQWAVDAYISPLDKVSSDSQQTWVKAPMIPELRMDYLLALDEESYYGPTTVGAVRDFVASGEIDEETIITNCRTGEEKPLREYPIFHRPEVGLPPLEEPEAPIRSSIRENLQKRIRDLEAALVEERRLRQLSEGLRAKAEARLAELERLLT